MDEVFNSRMLKAVASLSSWTGQLDVTAMEGNHDTDAGIDFWIDGYADVSGRNLGRVIVQLKSLQKEQRVLAAKIESIQQSIAPPDEMTYPGAAHCYTAAWQLLAESLNALVSTKGWIVKLSRRVKAIKRAMRRRQREVFGDLSLLKKVWFLMHGAHPPDTQDVKNLGLLFGRVRF